MFRQKVKERLNRKASKSNISKVNWKRWIRIPVKRTSPFKDGSMKGTETFCWKLETTGASNTNSAELECSNNGRIYEIIFTFPAGSEFAYYVMLQRDGAIIFPSKLSQELRGDNQVKTYKVDLPFQRGSIIKVSMVSNIDITANAVKACWVDLSVRFK